jgi:hypothetical protein
VKNFGTWVGGEVEREGEGGEREQSGLFNDAVSC